MDSVVCSSTLCKYEVFVYLAGGGQTTWEDLTTTCSKQRYIYATVIIHLLSHLSYRKYFCLQSTKWKQLITQWRSLWRLQLNFNEELRLLSLTNTYLFNKEGLMSTKYPWVCGNLDDGRGLTSSTWQHPLHPSPSPLSTCHQSPCPVTCPLPLSPLTTSLPFSIIVSCFLFYLVKRSSSFQSIIKTWSHFVLYALSSKGIWPKRGRGGGLPLP